MVAFKLGGTNEGGNFDLALGFGTTQAAAVAATHTTLSTQISQLKKKYDAGWEAYDSSLLAPPFQFAGVTGKQWHQLVDEYYLSANVLKASEDKTFPRRWPPDWLSPGASRSGWLLARPGTQLCLHAAILSIWRMRRPKQRSALHRGSQHRPQGHGCDHPCQRLAIG
jgi:hypothetical protein